MIHDVITGSNRSEGWWYHESIVCTLGKGGSGGRHLKEITHSIDWGRAKPLQVENVRPGIVDGFRNLEGELEICHKSGKPCGSHLTFEDSDSYSRWSKLSDEARGRYPVFVGRGWICLECGNGYTHPPTRLGSVRANELKWTSKGERSVRSSDPTTPRRSRKWSL